jgi:hypothetical protein
MLQIGALLTGSGISTGKTNTFGLFLLVFTSTDSVTIVVFYASDRIFYVWGNNLGGIESDIGFIAKEAPLLYRPFAAWSSWRKDTPIARINDLVNVLRGFFFRILFMNTFGAQSAKLVNVEVCGTCG